MLSLLHAIICRFLFSISIVFFTESTRLEDVETEFWRGVSTWLELEGSSDITNLPV